MTALKNGFLVEMQICCYLQAFIPAFASIHSMPQVPVV